MYKPLIALTGSFCPQLSVCCNFSLIKNKNTLSDILICFQLGVHTTLLSSTAQTYCDGWFDDMCFKKRKKIYLEAEDSFLSHRNHCSLFSSFNQNPAGAMATIVSFYCASCWEKNKINKRCCCCFLWLISCCMTAECQQRWKNKTKDTYLLFDWETNTESWHLLLGTVFHWVKFSKCAAAKLSREKGQ